MNIAVAQIVSTSGTTMDATQVRSANSAASYQPGATPQEQCPPTRQGLKARANGRADGPGFQPSWIGETMTQGVALGWDEAGALPLRRARP